VFENLGGGMFRNISIEEELAEADAVATDIESHDPGIIYAYSLPLNPAERQHVPIKIGLTTTGDTGSESYSAVQADLLLRVSCRAQDMGGSARRRRRGRNPFDARSPWLEA